MSNSDLKDFDLVSARKNPRKDWEADFKQMKKRKEDDLIIPETIDIDMKGWEW
jgi:antitoxin MazE